MMTTKSRLTADELYATGLRNQWYAFCPSDSVEIGAVKHLRRLGIDWVAFRESSGQIRILEDRCPHRSAPLSLGDHLGDRLACKYHGVEVNGAGTVVSVPGMPGCALEGRTAVRSLPVVEQSGAVFAYVGDEAHPEPCELVLPDPLVDEAVASMLCYVEWKAPWRWAMENLLDPMHGTFLHHDSHSMFQGDTTARFRIRETDRGFFFEKTDQVGVNFDWVEFCRTGVDWVDLEIPYPPTAGPGGSFGIVGTCVPIDAETTAFFAWRYRRVSGWERDVWQFLYKTLLEERHWAVLEQDREMLERLPVNADEHEGLYQHDLGLVRLRRLYRQLAEKQAAEAL